MCVSRAEKIEESHVGNLWLNGLYHVDFRIYLLIRCQKTRAEIQKMYIAISKDAKNLLQSTFGEEDKNT